MNVKYSEDVPSPMDVSCLLLLEQVPLFITLLFKNSPATFIFFFFQMYTGIICSLSDKSSGTPVGTAWRLSIHLGSAGGFKVPVFSPAMGWSPADSSLLPCFCSELRGEQGETSGNSPAWRESSGGGGGSDQGKPVRKKSCQ